MVISPKTMEITSISLDLLEILSLVITSSEKTLLVRNTPVSASNVVEDTKTPCRKLAGSLITRLSSKTIQKALATRKIKIMKNNIRPGILLIDGIITLSQGKTKFDQKLLIFFNIKSIKGIPSPFNAGAVATLTLCNFRIALRSH